MKVTRFFYSLCPHCFSGNDPVLKTKIWYCGTKINDPQDRTKYCYRLQLEKIKTGEIKPENIRS